MFNQKLMEKKALHLLSVAVAVAPLMAAADAVEAPAGLAGVVSIPADSSPRVTRTAMTAVRFDGACTRTSGDGMAIPQ